MITGDKINIEWRVIPGQKGMRKATAELKLQASVNVQLSENLLDAYSFRTAVEFDLRQAIFQSIYGEVLEELPPILHDLLKCQTLMSSTQWKDVNNRIGKVLSKMRHQAQPIAPRIISEINGDK